MSISKVNVSGTDHQIVGSPRYATCSTAAATAAKVATIADGSSTFSLEKGARICVSFTYANTASAATLNVASTGAKAICWNGSALVSSQYWQAGAVVDFVYDGNGWSIVGVAKDNNSTNFLPLSGGSLTGNLTVGSSSIGTNGYVEGTWLRTTKATESAGNFATISGDGWIYKRAPANVLGDIGGQAKITANGFLKGDGTGVITADKPVFWVTITQNTTDNLYSADKTYSEIIEAYNNGYMVQAKYSVDDGTNKEIYSLMSTYRSGSVKMLYFVYLNNHEEKRFTCRVTATAEKWLYTESSLVPSNLTINNKPLSSNITLTPSDINAQSKITANGILKGDGNGNITAADETEVELVDLPIRAEAINIPKGRMRGDVDGDGKITQNDLQLMQDALNNIISLTDIQTWCADINGDGLFKANDKTILTRYINGWAVSLTSTPTFADYYNNWTYVKVDDLTGYWTTEISIADLTTSNNVVVNICETFPMGQFYKAEVSTGKVKIYATTPPINDIPATITISPGSGKGSIPSYAQPEIFWATYGKTTNAELEEAYNANKLIMLWHDNKVYYLTSKMSNFLYEFFAFVPNSYWKAFYIICYNNQWQATSMTGTLFDRSSSLSLPTASWTGSDPYTQTVTLSDSAADTKVDIQPSEELYDQLVADNVGYLAIKNVDGALTAVAKGGKPSVDLTVQVTYNSVH